MSFCYDTMSLAGPRESTSFDPLKCDAVKCYLDHYANSLILHFFIAKGTIAEKHQANKELEICERKMGYWKRQPHFIHDEALRGQSRLNKSYQ